jgi:polyphosphate kinase 2 (PPK2 family)
VLILIAGVEGAGKGETVNLLNEWMDPRHISTSAFFEPSSEEAERPAQWRFWKALPPKGKSASSSAPGIRCRSSSASSAESRRASSRRS